MSRSSLDVRLNICIELGRTGMSVESGLIDISGRRIWKGQHVQTPKDKEGAVSHFDQVAIVIQCVLYVLLTRDLQAVWVRLHHVSHLYRGQGLRRNKSTPTCFI